MRRVRISEYGREQWGIDLSPATYAKLAVLGNGPLFHKLGRWPMYDPDDYDTWAKARLGKARSNTASEDE